MNFLPKKKVGRRRRPPRAHSAGTNVIGFQPSDVDRDALRSEVRGAIGRLAKGALDETSGGVLDRLIIAWSKQWLAHLAQDFIRFRVRAQERQARLTAALDKFEKRLRQAERASADREHEREAARLRMLGATPTPEPGTARPGGMPASANEGGPAPTPMPGGDMLPSADPTSLTGRAGHGLFYLIALLFAVGADIAAFVNVLELAMPNQDQSIVIVLVLGFTAVVVVLAHGAGSLLRDRRAGVGWIPAFAVPLCVSIWLSLGLIAAWVRWMFGSVPNDIGTIAVGAASQPESRVTYAIPAALIFLALYIGSGLVAALGAYVGNNRLQAAFRNAANAHDRSIKHVVTCADALERQKAKCASQADALAVAEETLRQQEDSLLAFADELQQHARQLIAEKALDPAVTDVITNHLQLLPGPQSRESA
ncbi:hypothetical protein [Kutzneria sp. NPDC052558]|uniref:hypothetical protein n=1 Tax=Kutzneria sp. NPDC052558 TaxID=3364121 RepID=UPI0037CC8ABE